MIHRYLFKEAFLPFIMITSALVALLITAELASLLQLTLRGQFSDGAIFQAIAYQIPVLLSDLIPPAYLLALLITGNRLSQDSERTVLLASGFSNRNLLGSLLLTTALPITILLWALYLFVAPTYLLASEQLLFEQRNRPITDLITPGSFINYPGIEATLFAKNATPSEGALNDVFVFQPNSNGYSVILAQSLAAEYGNHARFIFEAGNQYQFSENTLRQQMAFANNQILLPYETETFRSAKIAVVSTDDLLESTAQWYRAELSQRLLAPLVIPLFCIWAIGLTKAKPRQSKVGAIAIGLLLFFVYTSITRTVHSAVMYSKVPLWMDYWWLHVLAAITAWLLFFRRGQA